MNVTKLTETEQTQLYCEVCKETDAKILISFDRWDSVYICRACAHDLVRLLTPKIEDK